MSGKDSSAVFVRGRGVEVVAMFVVLVFSTQVHTTIACPKDCFCPKLSRSVQCTNMYFPTIPDGIPSDTIVLNLNENKFRDKALAKRNFTDLYTLENLYISDCGIETLAVDTFANLDNLIWLDLSKNNIRFVADFTFRGLHLKHLFINDNVGLQLSIGAFAGMTTQGLYMNSCGLRRLNVDRMTPLNGSLKTLWLHGNRFQAFNEKWKYFFQQLAHVRLGGNEFHCNCEIQWLYTFFKNSKMSLFTDDGQPKCASPPLVTGKMFEDLTKEDFRCELPTFQNVDAVFDTKMSKLTCQARGDPAPTLYWVHPDGTIDTYYPHDDESPETMGVMFMTGMKLENKERYTCVASNPAGNVTFSLNVAWPNLKPTSAPTSKPTKAATVDDNRNVIRAGTSSSTPANKGYRNYAGDDSEVYGWTGVNSESKMTNTKSVEGSSPEDSNNQFSLVDIIGAVMGTFLLTLLISVTVFHFYYRRRERLQQEDHYSVPDDVNNKRGPNSVYIMNDTDENRIKMINHHSPTECPS